MSKPELAAIIVAAGESRRMGFDKLMAPLAGRPLVTHSLMAFEACPEVTEVILVCSASRLVEFDALIPEFPKVRQVVAGGNERVDSVLCGLEAFQEAPQFVAVHDGARPLILPSAISTCYHAAQECGASVSAEPVTDTLHRADTQLMATETVSRQNLWRMQTPQILQFDVLKFLLEDARQAGEPVTDEISVLLKAGRKARVVENTDWNFKVTYPRDLELAELILRHRKS